MGILWSRFRSKPTTKELLEEVQKEIDSHEDYKRSTELQQKTVIRALILYSALIYIAVLGFSLYSAYPVNSREKIVKLLPLLLVPIILYIFKKFIQWYFIQKLRHNDENLLELQKRKKSLLELAKETETYKNVKELLEKFDPENHKKIFELKPFIDASSPSLFPGNFADMELRRRNVSPKSSQMVLRAPGPTLSFNTPTGPSNVLPRFNARTNLPSFTPAFPLRGTQRFGQPPMPQMPRPILPRERTFVDRLVDYVVGDGPSNRYALICRQCKSHNGMALREEFEFIAFRCCYCFQLNPPRSEHPPPPQLRLPAPSTAPTITEVTDAAPLEALPSSSDDEGIIETDSEQESIKSSKDGENRSELDNFSRGNLSKISSASESELANLVEDKPYSSADSPEQRGQN